MVSQVLLHFIYWRTTNLNTQCIVTFIIRLTTTTSSSLAPVIMKYQLIYNHFLQVMHLDIKPNKYNHNGPYVRLSQLCS
jgi:hypothetical protein